MGTNTSINTATIVVVDNDIHSKGEEKQQVKITENIDIDVLKADISNATMVVDNNNNDNNNNNTAIENKDNIVSNSINSTSNSSNNNNNNNNNAPWLYPWLSSKDDHDILRQRVQAQKDLTGKMEQLRIEKFLELCKWIEKQVPIEGFKMDVKIEKMPTFKENGDGLESNNNNNNNNNARATTTIDD